MANDSIMPPLPRLSSSSRLHRALKHRANFLPPLRG